MPFFQKKPDTIEAIQYNGKNPYAIAHFIGRTPTVTIDNSLIIPTLEGDMRASVNDWIIRGVKGEFYPCKPDIFAETYTAVDA